MGAVPPSGSPLWEQCWPSTPVVQREGQGKGMDSHREPRELLLEPCRFPISSAVSSWLGNPGSSATKWDSPAGPLGAEEGAAGISPS